LFDIEADQAGDDRDSIKNKKPHRMLRVDEVVFTRTNSQQRAGSLTEAHCCVELPRKLGRVADSHAAMFAEIDAHNDFFEFNHVCQCFIDAR